LSGVKPGRASYKVGVRRTACVIALLAALAGCGHSSSQRSAAGPPPAPRDPAPQGRLSAAEYSAIVGEYSLLKPFRTNDNVPDASRRARAACGQTRPNTHLMVLVRRDCLNALLFFAALRQIEAEPYNGAHYQQLASAIRATVANAELINAELRRRGIGGVCAQSIGIPQAQVSAENAAARAAPDGAHAADNGDVHAFLLAQHRLADALAREPGGDPLTGIKRTCPHHAPRSPAPHAPPRLPKPGDKIKA
jgi:hypothetical protein